MRYAWITLALGLLAIAGLAPSTSARPSQQLVFQPSSSATPQQGSSTHARLLEQARQHPRSATLAPVGTDDQSILFDRWSLTLGGERVVVFSGEFHPWRLPVPARWEEVLRQLKAGGFNAVSIYTSWALSQPSSHNPPSLTGFNDLERFLQLAERVGLWVIVRPGPYINAETTVGGVPGWATRLPVTLRTNATAYTQAWRPYMQQVAEVVKRHELRWNGKRGRERRVEGSVIMFQVDNEYQEGAARTPYMRLLAETVKYEWGVRVPISYNDAGRDGNFLSLLGDDDDDAGERGPLDLFGIDFYVQRFDCSHPQTWYPTPFDWAELHEQQAPSRPFLVPEYQAGSYDPYGGPGYGACRALTNGVQYTRAAAFAALAQRASVLSMYMAYGGTNWGALADTQTYTSYDYGAALAESLQPTEKLAEYRFQGHLLRTLGPDFAKVEIVGAGPGPGHRDGEAPSRGPSPGSLSPDVHATHLLNPDTASGYYFLRHANTTDNQKRGYRMQIETALGRFELPPPGGAGANEFALPARHADVVVADFKRLAHVHMVYSTCIPVYYQSYAGEDGNDEGEQEVLLVSMPLNASACFTYMIPPIPISSAARATPQGQLQLQHRIQPGSEPFVTAQAGGTAHGGVLLRFTSASAHAEGEGEGEGEGQIDVEQTPVVTLGLLDETMIGVLPRAGVESLYTPDVAGLSTRPAIIAPEAVILGATFEPEEDDEDAEGGSGSGGGVLHLTGKVSSVSSVFRITASARVRRVTFNGEPVHLVAERRGRPQLFIASGVLRGLTGEMQRWEPPALRTLDWRARGTLPEIARDYDVAKAGLTPADRTDSVNPHWRAGRGIRTEGQVLFAQEYGFHGNWLVWAGDVDVATVDERGASALNITVMGGANFAFSVWLNGRHLGSAHGDQQVSIASLHAEIPRGLLQPGQTARLVVVHDHMGVEMATGLSPFGLATTAADKEIPLDYSMKLPRGIISYDFTGFEHAGKVRWHVSGNPGGEDDADALRSNLNNGGLFAEHQGWHLPEHDDGEWPAAEDGWTAQDVRFFRTSFDLDVPAELDAALFLRMPAIEKMEKHGRRGGVKRALIYVNGWNYGKWISNLGPQRDYFLPDGILQHRGRNTLAIALWCVSEAGCELDEGPELIAKERWKSM